jgi:hypothetical protein
MDKFLRRDFKLNSPQAQVIFKAINDSMILHKLCEEEDFSAMSEVFRQVPEFIAKLPVPSVNPKDPLTEEVAAVMKTCFVFLHKFYLDFESKKDAKPALVNLLGLTFNGLLELGVSADSDKIVKLTSTYVRDVICEQPHLQLVIPQDMKMVCADIIFAQ